MKAHSANMAQTGTHLSTEALLIAWVRTLAVSIDSYHESVVGYVKKFTSH